MRLRSRLCALSEATARAHTALTAIPGCKTATRSSGGGGGGIRGRLPAPLDTAQISPQTASASVQWRNAARRARAMPLKRSGGGTRARRRSATTTAERLSAPPRPRVVIAPPQLLKSTCGAARNQEAAAVAATRARGPVATLTTRRAAPRAGLPRPWQSGQRRRRRHHTPLRPLPPVLLPPCRPRRAASSSASAECLPQTRSAMSTARWSSIVSPRTARCRRSSGAFTRSKTVRADARRGRLACGAWLPNKADRE